MKKCLMFIFLLTITFVFGQNYQDVIKRDFDNYHRLIVEKKVSEALDYTNPKLFQLIPREQMQKAFEAVFTMEGVQYKLFPPEYLHFEELKKIDNVDYVRFNHITPYEIKFVNIGDDEEKFEDLTKSLQNSFGIENVVYNQETGFYKINSHQVVIANSIDQMKNWKFVTIKNSVPNSVLVKIFPAEFLD